MTVAWPEGLPAHSPLGGSGAYRWMPCPGSVGLSEGVDDPESEFAAEGTAAHALAEFCLLRDWDAWKCIGNVVVNGTLLDPRLRTNDAKPGDGVEVTREMTDAVQIYLDRVRLKYPGVTLTPEFTFYAPTIHKWCYGTVDLPIPEVPGQSRVLDLWDLKYGVGIEVEVVWNEQEMYYACGWLEAHDAWGDYDYVRLHVAQPRGFHADGPIREWVISVSDLMTWLEEKLIPSMEWAENILQRWQSGMSAEDMLQHLTSGPHCRFCPARMNYCPQLLSDADEIERYLEMAKTKDIASFTNEDLGRFLDLEAVMKIAGKAARATGFSRAEKGSAIPNWKLVKARSNRAWKDKKAEAAVKRKFGDKAYTEVKLKSPNQIEDLLGGEEMATKYAHKPPKGLQLVPASDSRPEQGPDQKSMFKPVGKPATRKRK